MTGRNGGTETVHASAVAIGDDGILIRGPSGAGKSTLARELLQLAAIAGRDVALVADDRVVLSRAGGGVVAAPHPAGAGLLEVRGVGIARVPFRREARLTLVVDLSADEPPRLPADADRVVPLLGVPVPRIVAARPGNALLVLWRLSVDDDVFVTAY